MNKTRILTTLILVFLIGGGWAASYYGFGGASLSREIADYNNHIANGRNYTERGLYQLAINEYKQALTLKDSEDVRTTLLEVYQLRFEEDEDILEDYVNAAVEAADHYPNNQNFYIKAITLSVDNGSYYQANKYVEKAKAAGIESEELKKLELSVTYGFETNWNSYSMVRPYSNSYYAVKNGDMWGYVTATGSSTSNKGVDEAYSVGDNGKRLQVMNDRVVLIDDKKVVHGIFSVMPEGAGILSEEKICIKKDGKYGYYNGLGDYLFGEYEKAGAFKGGVAPVKTEEGMYFIDAEGKKVSDTIYKDIVMNGNGVWRVRDCMLANTGNGYQIFDAENKAIEGFSADEVDILTEDGIFAFKKDGKWGFANLNGEVVIAPAFNKAMSFSNGLAAVSNGDKWGFINKDGELGIDYQFMAADYFNDASSCFVETEANNWQIITLHLKK